MGGAGAIHSAARLKSINAKHLSYVTQCLGMMISLLPHIRAALIAQLPAKQHTLLAELDSIKNEYKDHNDKVLNKFVSIIGGIVEQGLAPRIASTDFDIRAQKLISANQDAVDVCVFLDGISSNTRKLHHVLDSLLPPDHLQDVFSRIFAHLDQKIPALFIAAASGTPKAGSSHFSFPSTDDGKRRLLIEVAHTIQTLNSLNGVHPWDFTAMNVLERKIDYKLPEASIGTSMEEQTSLPKNSMPRTGEDTVATVTEKEETAEVSGQKKRELTNEAEKPPEEDTPSEAEHTQSMNGTEESKEKSAKFNGCDNVEQANLIINGENPPPLPDNSGSKLEENG